jgi:hypothetical protein
MIFTALFTGVIIILGVLAAFATDFHWLVLIFQNDAVHDLIISGPWAAIIFAVRIIAIWRLYKWGNDGIGRGTHGVLTVVAVPVGVLCSILFWGMLYFDGFFGSYNGAQEAVFSLPLEVNILFAYLWIIVCEKLYDFLLWAEINKEEIKKKASDLWKRLTSNVFGYDISNLLLFLIPIATSVILISGLWHFMNDDHTQESAGILVESNWTQLYPASTDETSIAPTFDDESDSPYCYDNWAIYADGYWYVPTIPDHNMGEAGDIYADIMNVSRDKVIVVGYMSWSLDGQWIEGQGNWVSNVDGVITLNDEPCGSAWQVSR